MKSVGPGLVDSSQEVPGYRERNVLLVGFQVHWHNSARQEPGPHCMTQANSLPFESNNYYSTVERTEPTNSLPGLTS